MSYKLYHRLNEILGYKDPSITNPAIRQRTLFREAQDVMSLGARFGAMGYKRKSPFYANGSSASQARARLGRAKRRLLFRHRTLRKYRGLPLNTRTAGFLGVEHKFYDTAYAQAAIAGASTDCGGGEADPSGTSMITTPAVGDGEQNRDGRKIVIESLHIKGHMARSATQSTGTLNPGRVFLALVLDTQTNGAQMNSEDCFKALQATTDASVDCHRNLLFGSRFRVLKILKWTPNLMAYGWNGTTVNINQMNKSFEWHIKFPRGLHVNFNAGTTASVANVIDNSIHVIALASTTAFTLAYNARIRFQG